ncbi:hypothetical protein AA313_de0209407 [Arthrobotrys entomopaga]|nr:hypothetical protein AA313_de0209407 [Arthrobotrys entomopaga]
MSKVMFVMRCCGMRYFVVVWMCCVVLCCVRRVAEARLRLSFCAANTHANYTKLSPFPPLLLLPLLLSISSFKNHPVATSPSSITPPFLNLISFHQSLLVRLTNPFYFFIQTSVPNSFHHDRQS